MKEEEKVWIETGNSSPLYAFRAGADLASPPMSSPTLSVFLMLSNMLLSDAMLANVLVANVLFANDWDPPPHPSSAVRHGVAQILALKNHKVGFGIIRTRGARGCVQSQP